MAQGWAKHMLWIGNCNATANFFKLPVAVNCGGKGGTPGPCDVIPDVVPKGTVETVREKNARIFAEYQSRMSPEERQKDKEMREEIERKDAVVRATPAWRKKRARDIVKQEAYAKKMGGFDSQGVIENPTKAQEKKARAGRLPMGDGMIFASFAAAARWDAKQKE